MRSYPRNSPEAAARIVALVLIADGHVCRSELDALERLDVHRELGLQPGTLGAVVQALCEDLLTSAYASPTPLSTVDEGILALLMAEVDDPRLRHKVLQLATAAALADNHLADGEELVLRAARHHWGTGQAQLDSDETIPALRFA